MSNELPDDAKRYSDEVQERWVRAEAARLGREIGVRHPVAVNMDSPWIDDYGSYWDEEVPTFAMSRLSLHTDRDLLRAVIAHEVGHLRFGDDNPMFRVPVANMSAVQAVHRTLDSAALAALMKAWVQLSPRLAFRAVALEGVSLAAGQLVDAAQRRRELQADRYAVVLCGAESVVRMLEWRHEVAPHRAPTRLQSVLGGRSHPSIEQRIEAVKAFGKELADLEVSSSTAIAAAARRFRTGGHIAQHGGRPSRPNARMRIPIVGRIVPSERGTRR